MNNDLSFYQNIRIILRASENRKEIEEGIEFEIELTDEILTILNGLSNDELFDGTCKVDNNIHEIESNRNTLNGKTVIISLPIKDRPSKGMNVYNNFAEFLLKKNNQQDLPSIFYLIEEDFLYPENEPNKEIKHYIELIPFLKKLIELADHEVILNEKIVDKLIFLHKSKLEIQLEYDRTYLSEGLDGLSIFLSLMNDETNTDQKCSIVKEALHGLLINIKSNKRFSHLIGHFAEFSTRVNENYQLFVSEYSFDKVRREYEEKKREYIIQINNTFSDLSLKILSVPIALFLGVTRIKPIIKEDYVDILIQNSAMLTAFIIVSIYMYLLINNQKHSLLALKTEYSDLMKRLKSSYPSQYKIIEESKLDLEARYKTIIKYTTFYKVTVLLTFAFASMFFILRFPSISNKVSCWFSHLCP